MAGDAPTTSANGVPELEERLAADEERLTADEERLTRDEALLEAEEEEIGESRLVAWSGIALGCALIIAVTALVISVVALKDDVHQIRYSAGDDSVGTLAIRDSAVTTEKLASGAVSRDAIAGEAVGREEIEPNGITGPLVARDSLTSADIRERTLHTVPAARTARKADDSTLLGGAPPRAFLSSVVDIRAATLLDARRVKGPLVARCPSGSRIISGGAKIRGVVRDAAIVSSAPEAGTAWTATARVVGSAPRAWQLVVTAVCAKGGE